MELSKIPIKSWWQKIKAIALSFLSFLNHKHVSQDEVDKRLVYSLSTRKVPTGKQLRHLKKFLNPKEYLIIRICVFVLFVGAVYFGFVFFQGHSKVLPARGGTYSEGVVGYPKSINPLYAANRDVDADLSRLIYSSLFKYNSEGSLSLDLVSAYEISEDGKEYILKIRTDVTWHNGERLTVDDVVFTVETMQNPAFHSPLSVSLRAAVVEKIDEETVKFKLTEPYSPFLDLLTFGIMPKRLWEGVSADSAFLSDLNLKPIGSGPYKFKSLIRTSSGDIKEYSLEVNHNYYGTAPFIEIFNLKFYHNYEEAIKALNAKQISGLSYLPFSLRNELLTQNSLNFFELRQPRLVSIFFNQTKNTALADKEARVALAVALDKDSIIKEIFGDDYKSVNGPILPDNWAYSSDITTYSYDKESALSRFTANPLSITLTVVDSGFNSVLAEEVKKRWSEVGVTVSLRIISGEQAIDVVKNRDFEVLIYGQSVGGDPDVYAFWHSSQSGSAGLNLSNYNNPEADKLLTEARTSTNQDQRREKYQEFQKIVTADLPAIFLYSPAYTYVQGNKLQGFSGQVVISPSDRFATISNWYLKTDRGMAW